MRFIILSLVIVLCPSTSRSKELTSGIEARKIQINEVAPWSGVLMPYEQFQFHESELAACRYIQDHPQPCEVEGYSTIDLAAVGIVSFSLGALVAIFAK